MKPIERIIYSVLLCILVSSSAHAFVSIFDDVRIKNITNCSQALETDSDGDIVCGTDQSGSGGGGGDTNWTYSTSNGGQVTLATTTNKVGIGTTTPGARLSVGGDILGNKIIGASFTGTSTATSTFAGGIDAAGLKSSNGLHVTGGSALFGDATFDGTVRFTGAISGAATFQDGVDVGGDLSISGSLTVGGETFSDLTGDGLELSGTDLIFDCSDVAGTGITCSGEDITAEVVTAGDGLTKTLLDIDCDTASGSVFGCLSAADWTTFNKKTALPFATTFATSSMATTSSIWLQGGAYYASTSATSTFSAGLSVAGGGLATSKGITIAGGNILHSSANFLVTSDGHVGIGTLTPGTPFLNVQADSNVAGGTAIFQLGDSSDASLMTVDGAGALTLDDEIRITSAGSASDPNIFFGSDSTTGFFRPASDAIAISTDGTERLTITATGLIGIGSTTPGSILSVQSVANFRAGTSTMYSALKLPVIDATSTTATSTFANGIRLTGGCFQLPNGSCAGVGGGSGTPGGSDTQVQFNDASTFGGDAGLVYNKTSNTLDVANFLGVGLSNGGTASIEAAANGALQGLRIQGTNTTDLAFSTFVSGDSFVRFVFTPTGHMEWGPGTAVADTFLERSGHGKLSITGTGGLAMSHATSTGTLTIPQGTAPIANMVGNLALDTTSGQLLIATSTHPTAEPAVFGRVPDKLFGVTVASTSVFMNGAVGKLLPVPTETDGMTAYYARCHVSGGTSVVVNLTDGTNDTNAITCTTTSTEYPLTTNNNWTAGELISLERGVVTGSVDYISISVFGIWTRE